MDSREYYIPKFIMRRKDPESSRIVDLWTFKSEKSNKRFIIEVEGFERKFYGIKFYWKGVEKSQNRYSILTNDYEPRIVVRTCIEVMLHYYYDNPLVSFGFVAAPDLEKDIVGKRLNLETGSRRFKFYQRMMLNLFGPETFLQISDTSNTLYLLVNKRQLNQSFTIKQIEDLINRTYFGDYRLEDV